MDGRTVEVEALAAAEVRFGGATEAAAEAEEVVGVGGMGTGEEEGLAGLVEA